MPGGSFLWQRHVQCSLSLKHLHLILLQPVLHDWQVIILQMALGIGSLVIKRGCSLPSIADPPAPGAVGVGMFGRVILAHSHILDW
jgi:hypothetical protein